MEDTKEVILYTLIFTLLWMLSISYLLPVVLLLKFSKTFRDLWFSWFYVKISGTLQPAMDKMRKHGFNRLKDHLEDRKRVNPLEILEIGIGGGANLPFYPENSNLTVVEMNESFIKYFDVTLKKNPHVTLKRTVICMAEDMHEIDDNSFDVVICTYTLCSVVNQRAVLNEIKRVLKTGGKFLFIEHIPYPKCSWIYTLQRFADPLWRLFLNGCDVLRKTDEEIKITGFTDVSIDKRHPKEMWLMARSHIIGIATK